MGEVVSFQGYKPSPRFDDIAWAWVSIEEAAESQGPWVHIDTVILDPADDDPADPQERSFTTSSGTGPDLWYRVLFLDGFGGTSEPTAPIQNGLEAHVAFATSDDLAIRLGIELTGDEIDRASVLLGRASGLIQDEANLTLALVTDTITMPGTTDERIKLPQRPVISVDSVTLGGGELVEGRDWYLDGSVIIRLPRFVVTADGFTSEFSLGAGFGWPTQTLEISYTHGYIDVPASVKAICVEMVVRVWINPGGVARETVGDTSTVYDRERISPAGLLLTAEERRIISRLFPRPIRSISIGT